MASPARQNRRAARLASNDPTTCMKTPFQSNPFQALCAALLAALAAGAQAAPMTIPQMESRVANLFAGRYRATACIGRGVEQPPEGVLTIASDGHVTGPSVDLSLFDPAGMMGFALWRDGKPESLNIELTADMGGKALRLSRKVPSEGPGDLEAGLGQPNQDISQGSECQVDWSSARIAAPSFDLATYVAPMFATSAPVKATCRSLKRGAGPARPVQFTLDAHGVVVDGVALPFGSASRPVNHTDVGTRFSDGTINGSFFWADGSTFHAERLIEGDGFSMFGFTIQGKPDAQTMYCTPGA